MKVFYSIFFMGCLGFSMQGFAATELMSGATQVKLQINHLGSISCDTEAKHCVAVEFAQRAKQSNRFVFVSEDSGDSWSMPIPLLSPAHEQERSDDFDFMKVHCSSSGMDCILAGTTVVADEPSMVVYRSIDGGVSWSDPAVLSLQRSSEASMFEDNDLPSVQLACSDTGSQCLLGAGSVDHKPLVYSTQDGGQHWGQPVVFDAVDMTLAGLSCDDSGLVCTMLGTAAGGLTEAVDSPNMVYLTRDGGVTWSSSPFRVEVHDTVMSPKVDAATGIACDKSGVNCIAIGVYLVSPEDQVEPTIQPYSYVTHNGGSDWAQSRPLDAQLDIIPFSVDCDDLAKTCVVAGMKILAGDEAQPVAYITHDGALSWETVPYESSLKDAGFLSVFCDQHASICHVVGVSFVDS